MMMFCFELYEPGRTRRNQSVVGGRTDGRDMKSSLINIIFGNRYFVGGLTIPRISKNQNVQEKQNKIQLLKMQG